MLMIFPFSKCISSQGIDMYWEFAVRPLSKFPLHSFVGRESEETEGHHLSQDMTGIYIQHSIYSADSSTFLPGNISLTGVKIQQEWMLIKFSRCFYR